MEFGLSGAIFCSLASRRPACELVADWLRTGLRPASVKFDRPNLIGQIPLRYLARFSCIHIRTDGRTDGQRLCLMLALWWREHAKGQIPLRYPACEPARERIASWFASWSASC